MQVWLWGLWQEFQVQGISLPSPPIDSQCARGEVGKFRRKCDAQSLSILRENVSNFVQIETPRECLPQERGLQLSEVFAHFWISTWKGKALETSSSSSEWPKEETSAEFEGKRVSSGSVRGRTSVRTCSCRGWRWCWILSPILANSDNFESICTHDGHQKYRRTILRKNLTSKLRFCTSRAT